MRLCLSLAGLLLIATLSGCATVQPWERAVLSHPCMDLAPRLGDAHFGHVIAVREGALRGGAGIGGGCGCN